MMWFVGSDTRTVCNHRDCLNSSGDPVSKTCGESEGERLRQAEKVTHAVRGGVLEKTLAEMVAGTLETFGEIAQSSH